MLSHDKITEAIEKIKSDKEKTFAEFLDYMFHGKLVEVYISDLYETIETDQISSEYPAVFCGIVEGAYGQCLILNCAYLENKKKKFGHHLFINQYSISTINEVTDEGSMEHMIMRSRETPDVKKLLDSKGIKL